MDDQQEKIRKGYYWSFLEKDRERNEKGGTDLLRQG